MHLTIPLPTLSEQRRIVERLETLSGRVEEAKTLRKRSERDARLLIKAVLGSLVPADKDLGRLGDFLLDSPRNGWSAKCDNADDGVAVLTLGAVTGYRYDPRSHKRTSLATNPTAHYWLRAGDLLVTRSNTPELVGHAAIYDGRPHPCIYPDLMMRVTVDESRADMRFVWYWLQSPVVRRHIEVKAKGTRGVSRSQLTFRWLPRGSRSCGGS
jgi:type I restriction enzyme S subunit